MQKLNTRQVINEMAIVTDYRVPGVYSSETTGPRLNTTTTSNATVAFVGPALGYQSATQQMTLVDEEWVQLNNPGVVADSYVVRGRNNGTLYVPNEDYEAEQDADGTTRIKRKITQLSTSTNTVSSQKKQFYSAQPSFNILVDEEDGSPIDGHVIKGTLTVEGYTEGVDFDFDYLSNVFTARSGGALTNDIELSFNYKWTTAEPIQLVGEIAVGLNHKYISHKGLGIGDSAFTCSIVSCQSSSNNYGETPGADGGYIEDVDYVVDYTTGSIARTPTSRIPAYTDEENNLMYVAFGYCGIRTNELVTVSYKYVSEGYYEPAFYESYNAMSKVLGSPWDSSTGEIQSPISLAAYLASKNGMGGLYAVAVQGRRNSVSGEFIYPLASWEAAFESLTVIDGIDIVVPLSDDISVWQSCMEHVNKMKDNEDERVAMFGLDGTAQQFTDDMLVSRAQSLSDERAWLVGPSSFKFRNPITSEIDVISGYYMAAAVAGYNSYVPQYTPLTAKAVSGFYSANEYKTKSSKKNLSANGIMYVDETNSQMRIIHGRTTSQEGIVSQETNIVLTKDYIIKALRQSFANGYIGNIITDDTLLTIMSAAQSVLCALRDSHYLYSFSGLEVSQNALVPTQVDIEFEYKPTYGINYIQISFSIDSATITE